MNNFEFDLQLFAEEVMEQPEMDSAEQNESESQDFDFAIDENGDVVFNSDTFGDYGEPEGEGEDVPLDEKATQQEQEQAEPEPERYIVNIGGQETEVTLDELLHGYMRQADYTRKTQELAEQRRANEYQQAPQQPKPQETAQLEQPQFDQKTYYQQLAEFGKERVRQVLGEDYDEFNPIHQAVMGDSIATIKAEIYGEAEKNNRVQEVFNKYSQDPNFKQIDVYARELMENLPYKEGLKIQQAISNRDYRAIDEFMGFARDSFYKAQQQRYSEQQPPISIRPVRPKVNPPYVETSGGANTPPTPTTQQIDFKKFGQMTMDQQAEVFSKLGLSKF